MQCSTYNSLYLRYLADGAATVGLVLGAVRDCATKVVPAAGLAAPLVAVLTNIYQLYTVFIFSEGITSLKNGNCGKLLLSTLQLQ